VPVLSAIIRPEIRTAGACGPGATIVDGIEADQEALGSDVLTLKANLSPIRMLPFHGSAAGRVRGATAEHQE
jgi:hypothetical protein